MRAYVRDLGIPYTGKAKHDTITICFLRIQEIGKYNCTQSIEQEKGSIL